MITQAALYKALLRYVEENKVGRKDVESATSLINESTDKFLKTVTDSIKSFNKSLNKIDSSRDAFEKAAALTSKMAKNLDPLISTPIYERVDTLKDSIDVFETQILFKLGISPNESICSHRLRNMNRIRVFLISKFNAGKTTFVRRLLSGVSGQTASIPTTGCLVIHRQSSVPSFLVAFNKEFNVEKSKEFGRFLDDYNLSTFFTNRNGFFIPNDTEKVFDNWGDDKILNFLNEANEFPEAFDNIVWNHKKTGEGHSFLGFADLYDMPGIGGKKKHEEVIKKIINKQKPDIVLYLIDTSLGCPGKEELNVLPDILESLMQSKPFPLFYWVFQKPKPNNYNRLDIESLDADSVIYDEDFLKGKEKSKKKDLENFIDEISKNHTDRFSEEQINYLKETSILDARGLVEEIETEKDTEMDTEAAQNAVSLVLRDYFCINIKRYCENARKLLRSDDPATFEVMDYRPDSFLHSPENHFFQKKIIDQIKISFSVSDLRNLFRETLFIDRPYTEIGDFPFDLQNTLFAMITDIESIIENILGKIKKFGRKEVDFDELNKFWTNYEKKPLWQGLLFKVQAYHWLISHYRGNVAPLYINSIGFALLNNIEKDNKRLEETKIPFSLTAKLFEETE